MIRIACLLLLCSFQDSPGWRGAERDGNLPDFKAPGSWPGELTKGWSVEVGTGHATPALVDGKLYVHARQGEKETTLCLEADSGKEVWRDAYDVSYEMDPTATEHGKGPKSSPAVADGKVFTLGITSVLTCYDAKSGKVEWRHKFLERFNTPQPQYGTAMSPIVVDDLCIVHVGTKGKGAIVAIDVKTGKEKWAWTGDGPGYASPVVATVGGRKQIITQTQSFAVGLSVKTGKALWSQEYKTNYDQNSVTPAMAGSVVIISGYKNGTVAWKLGGAKPAEVWKTTDVSMYMSSPVIANGRIYGFSEKRRGQYFCMDLKTGKKIWTSRGRDGANAAVLVGDGVMFGLNTKSELVVIDAKASKYSELAKYTVADSPTWAHPVVSGRTIFVKDEKNLTKWQVE